MSYRIICKPRVLAELTAMQVPSKQAKPDIKTSLTTNANKTSKIQSQFDRFLK